MGDDNFSDEYDGYVSHLCRLAIEGKDRERIASSLKLTAETNMGVDSNHERNLFVADLILHAKNQLI